MSFLHAATGALLAFALVAGGDLGSAPHGGTLDGLQVLDARLHAAAGQACGAPQRGLAACRDLALGHGLDAAGEITAFLKQL